MADVESGRHSHYLRSLRKRISGKNCATAQFRENPKLISVISERDISRSNLRNSAEFPRSLRDSAAGFRDPSDPLGATHFGDERRRAPTDRHRKSREVRSVSVPVFDVVHLLIAPLPLLPSPRRSVGWVIGDCACVIGPRTCCGSPSHNGTMDWKKSDMELFTEIANFDFEFVVISILRGFFFKENVQENQL